MTARFLSNYHGAIRGVDGGFRPVLVSRVRGRVRVPRTTRPPVSWTGRTRCHPPHPCAFLFLCFPSHAGGGDGSSSRQPKASSLGSPGGNWVVRTHLACVGVRRRVCWFLKKKSTLLTVLRVLLERKFRGRVESEHSSAPLLGNKSLRDSRRIWRTAGSSRYPRRCAPCRRR